MLIDDSPIESEYEWSGELGLPNDAVCTEKLALRCCFVGAAWDADADVAPAAEQAVPCHAALGCSQWHSYYAVSGRQYSYDRSARHSYLLSEDCTDSTISFLQAISIAQRR
jgi:hypothetical protein